MTDYIIDLAPAAAKSLRRIKDRRLKSRLIAALLALQTDPCPDGTVKLVGEADKWRVRVGDWRIVYVIDDGRLVVLVVTVAVRGEVYG